MRRIGYSGSAPLPELRDRWQQHRCFPCDNVTFSQRAVPENTFALLEIKLGALLSFIGNS